jgi:hypothetical protein
MTIQTPQLDQNFFWTAEIPNLSPPGGEDVSLTITMSVPPNPSWTSGSTFAVYIFTNDWSELLATISTYTVSDLVNGIVTFTIPSAQTGLLGRGRFRYAVWRTDIGNRKKIAVGQIAAL